MMKKALAILISASLAVAFIVAPVNATTRLGEIRDPQVVCTYQNAGTALLYPPFNVVSWKCVSGGTQTGLSMYGYCVHKYGSTANASYDSWSDAYSWYCYR